MHEVGNQPRRSISVSRLIRMLDGRREAAGFLTSPYLEIVHSADNILSHSYRGLSFRQYGDHIPYLVTILFRLRLLEWVEYCLHYQHVFMICRLITHGDNNKFTYMVFMVSLNGLKILLLCCIMRCPGGERIVDVVTWGTELEPQVKTGSWSCRTHSQ